MDHYLVLTGDLENSRELRPAIRKEAQKNLHAVFEEINQHSKELLAPYTITLGDEFQAVYQQADQIFLHIWMIMAQIHPVTVRVSIGMGELTTDINREKPFEMDGPAFHKSRAGMENLKKNQSLLSLITEQDAQFDRLINSMFKIVTAELRSWNDNRFRILRRFYEEAEVKDIAEETGLSDVAVYKNIRAGSLDAILEFTESLEEMINRMLGSA